MEHEEAEESMKEERIPAAGPERDEYYMKLAIREARKALKYEDVPIGCILVYDGSNPMSKADQHAATLEIAPGTILGRGYNRRNRDHNALMHAEMIAIRQACRKLQDWRVEDCTLYVTLEPCPMCAGAIVQTRVPRVVIGSMNPKAGCCGSVLDMLHEKRLNHRCEVRTEVEKDACAALLSDFFQGLREKKLQKLEEKA